MAKPIAQKPRTAPPFMPQARAAYDKGVPLRVLIRRLQLSRSEAQDLAPEEFEAHDEDRNPMTGY